MAQQMQPVACHTCNELIGVIPLGWEVPQFIVCMSCREKQILGDEEE